jgi:hypothetical protein
MTSGFAITHAEPPPWFFWAPMDLADKTFVLKITPIYGASHLCWEPGCDLWVCDGPDHKCVLHSDEPWARTMRRAWVATHCYATVEGDVAVAD